MPSLPAEYIDIRALVSDDAWPQIRELFLSAHPADIADLIDRAPRDSHAQLFELIDDDIKPDVLAELDPEAGNEILSALTSQEISNLVEEMSPDDAADILGDLPDDRSDEVLKLMEEDDSEDVRRLLKYPEDSAGGIMTTKVVAMKAAQTVAEAIAAIAELDESEPFVYAYITDDEKRLTGVVNIWELLRERDKDRKLQDIAHTSIVAANVKDDQEEVAHIMSQYDLSAIPVIDEQGILVGRVTSDDVIDVIEEEATEDILRMAGLDDAILETTSPVRDVAIRLPWLFITLGGGLLTALILNAFRQYTAQIGLLAVFVPAILAMGGNTGIQTSTLMVRSIALQGSASNRSLLRILSREIGTGALMGLVCGLLIGLWAHFLASREASLILPPFQLASIVATALFSAMTFAAIFGAMVPLALDRFRIDPAVASGPFVSIANDISALLIYFAVTVGMLHSFTT